MDFHYSALFLLILITSGSVADAGEDQENDEDDLQRHILALDDYIYNQMITKQPGNGTRPPDVPNMSIFTQLYETAADRIKTATMCFACKVGVGLLMFKVRQANASGADIQRLTIFTCRLFQIGTPEVCNGIIERYGPVFSYLFKEVPELSAKSFCGVMLQAYGCSTDDARLDWTVDIPPGNPEPPREEPNAETQIRGPLQRQHGVNNTGRIKIIQLSDLHIDPLYEAGSNAECDNKILCCQGSQGRPLEKALQAGTFGDSRKCDPPYSTLELALKHISKQHADAELFYMTGDIVPHNIWSTTQADNTKVIHHVAKLIRQYFPTMLVIPVLGNHEPHPVNFYSPYGVPPEYSTTWIYNITYDVYKDWIPKSQSDLYLTYGYFAREISDKFKILVVNTNFCYGFNVWQMYKPGDTGDQLKWLVQHLQDAEGKGQTVHIVGHVPPGHDECFRVFSRNFYQIILRYHRTIKGQFYGHTHYAELKVVYDLNYQPINNLWISPSLTPYEINNAGYRVYFADPLTYEIMDHETWLFDLRGANDNGTEPNWFSLYSGSAAYDVPDVTPKSMGILLDKMAEDATTFQKFYQHYFKLLDTDKGVPCNTHCRKRLLCGIVKSYYGEEDNCNRIQKKVDGIALPISLL